MIKRLDEVAPEMVTKLAIEVYKKGEGILLSGIYNAMATDEIGTMATDGRALYINPEFVERIGIECAVGVLAHELLHNYYFHQTVQWQNYIQDDLVDEGNWRQLVNMAMDVVINDSVRAMGFKLPPEGQFREELNIPQDLQVSQQIFEYLLNLFKTNETERRKLQEIIDKLKMEKEKKDKLIKVSPPKMKVAGGQKQEKKDEKKDEKKGMTREQLILAILREQQNAE